MPSLPLGGVSFVCPTCWSLAKRLTVICLRVLPGIVYRVLTSPAITVAFLALLSVLSVLVSCILKLCYLVLPHLELLCLLCTLTGLSLGNTPLYCW